MEDKIKNGHSVTLENRESISLTGVTDVLSFDEESITADTEMGALMIKGEELHVTRLDLERGILAVDGEITSLEYNDGGFGKRKTSMFSRIFK